MQMAGRSPASFFAQKATAEPGERITETQFAVYLPSTGYLSLSVILSVTTKPIERTLSNHFISINAVIVNLHPQFGKRLANSLPGIDELRFVGIALKQNKIDILARGECPS